MKPIKHTFENTPWLGWKADKVLREGIKSEIIAEVCETVVHVSVWWRFED